MWRAPLPVERTREAVAARLATLRAERWRSVGALELAQLAESSAPPFPALFGEWAVSFIRGEPMTPLANRFSALADKSSDSAPHLVALRLQAHERLRRGQFAESLTLLDQVLAHYDPDAHLQLRLEFAHDPRAAALLFRSWALWHLGYPDQAQRSGAQAITYAHELNHAQTIGSSECWGGLSPSALARAFGQVET